MINVTDRDKLAQIILKARINANPLSQVGYAEADALLANGVIVPPCKVGDKVYKITRNKVKECEVVFIGISIKEKYSYFNSVENYADGTFYKSYSMDFDVIGKTVFLTREEAEAELRKRGVSNAENN
jgi:hypothetical protein